MEQLKAPEAIDFDSKNLPQDWRRWKEELSLYLELAMAKQDEKMKVKMFKYLIGQLGREIYETMCFETEEKDRTVKELFGAFDQHCDPKRNETVERYKFFTRAQEPDESFEKYLTELKLLAATCNFENLKDSLLRDRLICGVRDSHLRERLLREISLDLAKCLQICRAAELSKARSKELETAEAIHQMGKGKPGKSKFGPRQETKAVACIYCGKRHEIVKEKCMAYGQTCRKCLKKNHFASQCLSGKKQVKFVHEEDEEDDHDGYEEIKTVSLTPEVVQVNTVSETKYPKQLYATMQIGRKSVKFQLDSGATCNVITTKALDGHEDFTLTKTEQVLSMYNQTTVRHLGRCQVKMVNPKNGKRYKVDFVVMESNCMPLLGSRAVQQMGLVTVQHENILTMGEDIEKKTSSSYQRSVT